MAEFFRIVRCFFLLAGFSLVAACSPLPAQRPAMQVENAHHFASTQVQFNPGGGLLATAGLGGDIKIWSFPAMTPIMTLAVHKNAVRGLVWFNDRILISGGDDGRTVVWDLAKDEQQQIRVELFSSPIKGLAFLSAGGELVAGHRDGTIRVLELPSLRILRERNLGRRVLALRSRPDGAGLAVSTAGKQVFLLDRALQVARELPMPNREIYSLAFSPDGRKLAGGAWFKLSIWDLFTNSLAEWDSPHFGKIASLDFSPDGGRLASIGRISDSKIFLLNARTGKPVRYLLRHSLCGAALQFSPDGRYIASASDDRSVRVYDLTEPYPPR